MNRAIEADGLSEPAIAEADDWRGGTNWRFFGMLFATISLSHDSATSRTAALAGRMVKFQAKEKKMEQQAGGITQQAREKARSAGEELRTQAKQTASQMREQGQSMVAEQKERLAKNLHDLGDAIRGTAERLHQEEDHNLAGYTEAVAQRIDRTADYLQNHDVRDLMNRGQQIARRHPGLVCGGMLLAGVAMGRFLKSNRPRHDGGMSHPGPHADLPAPPASVATPRETPIRPAVPPQPTASESLGGVQTTTGDLPPADLTREDEFGRRTMPPLG